MCLKGKFVVLYFLSIAFSGTLAVYIENNGYKGVAVSFSPSIQKNEVNTTKLKNVIQKASEVLYRATRRRAFFSDVDFIYPSNWPSSCEQNTVKEEKPQGISVYVASFGNEDGKDLLFTQHSKGCGAVGEVIYMSSSWLSGDEEELSREFVRQWAIYRYGVFEETSEPGGWTCYTNDGERWIQNGCYSTDISVSLTLDHDGLPSCESVNIDDHADLKSSLMSTVTPTNVTDFCDGSKLLPHNPLAPTRHNRICRGRPVWSVIKKSEDFRYGRNLPKKEDFAPPEISFRCFQESSNHVIFSIQIYSTENVGKIVDNLRLPLLRFFLFDVRPETQVTIIPFHAKAESPFVLNLTQPKTVYEELDLKIRSLDTVPDICLSCGIENAFNVSRSNEEKTTSVVLIVFASALKGHNLGEFVDLLASSPSRTYLIIIQDHHQDFVTPNLVKAARKTGGEVFMVPIFPPLLTTKLTMYLSGVLRNGFGIQDNAIVIYQASYFDIIGRDTTTAVINDVVEADIYLEGELTYNLMCDTNVYRLNITGNCSSTLPNMDGMSGAFTCSYTATLKKENNVRKWTISISDKGGIDPFTCSSIATVRLRENVGDSLTVRGWLSTDTFDPNYPEHSSLIIYAEIMKNSVPVKNAWIVADVYSSTNSTPTRTELLDTGNGDPDMKKGDGIYSRYFTRIYDRGIHSVIIYAKGNIVSEDSATINQDETKFSRVVTAGSFLVTEKPKYVDHYPPNRIGDLRVASIDHNNSIVTLQWTAPGDNYDDGTVEGYEAFCTTEWKDLRDGVFTTMVDRLVQLVSKNNAISFMKSGNTEEIQFYLPTGNSSALYYIALRAKDKYRNYGPLSETVQVYRHYQNMLPTLINDTTEQTTTEQMTSFAPAKDKVEDRRNFLLTVVTPISGSIFVLLLILNISLWLVCSRRQRKGSHDRKVLDQHLEEFATSTTKSFKTQKPLTSSADCIVDNEFQSNGDCSLNSTESDSEKNNSAEYSFPNVPERRHDHRQNEPVYAVSSKQRISSNLTTPKQTSSTSTSQQRKGKESSAAYF